MASSKTKAKEAAKKEINALNFDGSSLYDRLVQLGGTDDDGNVKVSDPGFERQGSKIILPAIPSPMPIVEAVGALLRYMEEEETEMDAREDILAFPADAAVAFNKALKEIYGWAESVPTPGFFGPQPPQMITVQTGPKKTDFVQVPWGSFQIPGIENRLTLDAYPTPDGMMTVLYGSVKKRERHVLVNLANRTREILELESIYKGKAIELRPAADGTLDLSNAPTFFDPGNAELILNDDEMGHLESSLWAPIKYTMQCISAKIPLKRGVLLEGSYGIGKTLCGKQTASIAIDNGWTFIMLDDVRALKTALIFAKRYQPAIVFAEDIDRLAANRDQAGNDLLNVIDGVISKDAQVITVLTTNFVEKINKAMLRPGRLDAVISVRPPQAKAVKRLLRLYGRDQLDSNEPLEKISDALAGQIPATIREVVERSKLSMIYNQRTRVTEEDLLNAAHGMKAHLDLLKEQPAPKSIEEQVGSSLMDLLAKRDVAERETMNNVDRNILQLGNRLSVTLKDKPAPTT